MKKNRIFGILLSLALMLGMIPVFSIPAYAAEADYTWDADKSVTTDENYAGFVEVTNDITIRIAKDKTLTVTGVIYAYGKKVTVKGPGKLVVNAPENNNAFTGNIIVKGADVEITGGIGDGTDEYPYNEGKWGIYGNAIVDDGSLTVTGGNGANGTHGGDGGIGIFGALTVNGGSAFARGGNGGSGEQSGDPGKAVDKELTGKTIEVSSDGVNYSQISSGATSKMQYVRATGTDPVSVKLDVGEGHANMIDDDVLASLVDYEYDYGKIDASYATIGGNVITIYGIKASTKQNDFCIVLRHFVNNILFFSSYRHNGEMFYNIGYKPMEEYVTKNDYDEDIDSADHEAAITDGMSYYFLWQKPYTKLEIGSGNPVCGMESKDVKPTLPEGVIQQSYSESKWTDEAGGVVESFKGGEKYTYKVLAELDSTGSLWKYFFDKNNFTAVVKGGEVDKIQWLDGMPLITFKATADHDWDEGKVTKEPTTTSEGEKTYTCKTVDCGATKTETIPKIKPTPTPTPTPEPTPTPKPTPSKKTAKTVVVAKAIASGKTKAKLSWNDAGADRYVIYRGICGKNMKKYKTVNGRTRKLTVSKLRSGEKYRFCVVAQKKSGKSYRTIATSGDAHMAVGNVSGSYTNVKDLKVNRKAVNLKKGRSFRIKTGLTKVRKDKRLLNSSHDKSVRFTTTDPGVAVVNSKGKITAKGKGSCRVYVQAVNGLWKTVRVTVK